MIYDLCNGELNSISGGGKCLCLSDDLGCCDADMIDKCWAIIDAQDKPGVISCWTCKGTMSCYTDEHIYWVGEVTRTECINHCCSMPKQEFGPYARFGADHLMVTC